MSVTWLAGVAGMYGSSDGAMLYGLTNSVLKYSVLKYSVLKNSVLKNSVLKYSVLMESDQRRHCWRTHFLADPGEARAALQTPP